MSDTNRKRLYIRNMDERRLSILVFSLFFSWMLALPFEGQILYSFAQRYNIDPHTMIFSSIAAQFAGLFFCQYFVKTMQTAKRLLLFSIVFCIIGSIVFFLAPSLLWNTVLLLGSFLAGACVAAWAFYLKSSTPSNERIKTTADGLIYSNILMILLNMTAIHLSPNIALGLSMLMLGGALFFAGQLPADDQLNTPSPPETIQNDISIVKPFIFLYLFILIISINSGLMYQVINPAFAHLEWIASWYWAVPYIVALYVMKNLPRKTNRTYILYVAIAMIGLAFIAFMTLDRSVVSYLLVDTLMLGACGVYDLFWWSILGEMLDFDKNPAKILGVGLSANVLGVLAGGFIGNAIYTVDTQNFDPSRLALVIVFIILIILPLLHRQLSILLKNHAFLTMLSEAYPSEPNRSLNNLTTIRQLTSRESEIAMLLLRGRTYKMIAEELYVSENTVKTHIKNIYSKLNIQKKSELINLLAEKERPVSI